MITVVRLLHWLLAATLLVGAAGLQAHPLPASSVWLDIGAASVDAELALPLADLEIAYTHDPADPAARRLGPTPFTAAPEQVLPRDAPQLAAYIGRHVRPRSVDGTPWSVQVLTLSLAAAATPQLLDVRLRMTPAGGASTEHLDFGYDVITHEVMSHEALVSVRSDWNRGVLPTRPQLVGSIRWQVRSLRIDRPSGSVWAGFAAAIRLGVEHIADGTDHLMFLLTLLLPAPLLLAGRRWGAYAGVRPMVGQFARVVSAFTVGHTITLIAGARGWLVLPPQAVEIAIAVTIAVSALHAWRPLYPRRETWVAGGFGLIHGAAFASVIVAQGFDPWHAALAILGFNLGIEAMQLLVVGIALPALLLSAPRSGYAVMRGGGALIAMACAMVWLADRSGWMGVPRVG